MIDLVIYNDSVKTPETEIDDSKLAEVFELKLAKSKTGEQYSDEHQKVFDDVIRLAYYNMWGKKDCYFLMCGTYENFKTFFVGQNSRAKPEGGKNILVPKQVKKIEDFGIPETEEWLPSGLYKEWFGFKPGEPVSIEFNDSSDKWGLKPFQKNYEPRDPGHKFISTIKIRTTCIALTPVEEKNKTHAAGLWKIEGIEKTL